MSYSISGTGNPSGRCELIRGLASLLKGDVKGALAGGERAMLEIVMATHAGIEFMRPWTEKLYGIPPEQVIGSSSKTNFELRDG